MKMNRLEKLAVNSLLRTTYVRYVILPYLLRQVKLPSNPLCLEIGCGIGYGAASAHRRLESRHFVALDYDPDQLRLARRRFSHLSHLTFIEGNAGSLPLKESCFDIVFNLGSFHHVEEWRQAIADVYRVLKPGGIFFFEDIFRPMVDMLSLLRIEHPEKGEFHDYEFINTMELTRFYPDKTFPDRPPLCHRGSPYRLTRIIRAN